MLHQNKKHLAKQASRAHFKKELQQLFTNAQNVQRLNQKLNHRLVQFLSSRTGTWAAFMPLAHEVDVTDAILKSQHLNWVFPKIFGTDLKFFKAPLAEFGLAPGAFEKNEWGILEPKLQHPQVAEVELFKIDGFLLPALAYDRDGTRLGKGKGFYDRALSESQAEKVGVAFEVQIAQSQLPSEVHDKKVGWILTEDAIYEAKT